jgi:hypothetical protein
MFRSSLLPPSWGWQSAPCGFWHNLQEEKCRWCNMVCRNFGQSGHLNNLVQDPHLLLLLQIWLAKTAWKLPIQQTHFISYCRVVVKPPEPHSVTLKMAAEYPSEILEHNFTMWYTNPKKWQLFEQLARHVKSWCERSSSQLTVPA